MNLNHGDDGETVGQMVRITTLRTRILLQKWHKILNLSLQIDIEVSTKSPCLLTRTWDQCLYDDPTALIRARTHGPYRCTANRHLYFLDTFVEIWVAVLKSIMGQTHIP